MSREQLREKTVNEGCPSGDKDTPLTHARSRVVRRQLLHLSSVYLSSSDYYREALRPVIKRMINRIDGERA